VIDANQAGNGTYTAAPQQQQSLTIASAAKTPQTIAFTSTPPTNPTVGGGYTVTATGGASGNAVTFSIDLSSATGACAISGATVSLTGAGECLIDANQAGNANYTAAPQAQQTLSIVPALTIATSPEDATVTAGASAVFTASASGATGVQWEVLTVGASNWVPVSGDVSGATADTLTVLGTTLAQSGEGYRAVFSNAGGSAASGAATLTVNPPPAQTSPPTVTQPANTVPPAISGPAQQGQSLSASQGSWTNSPSSFAYQWSRCDSLGGNCSPITGATSSGYTPSAADAGSTLRVTVTATNAGNSVAATSAPTALVGGLEASLAAPVLGVSTDLSPVNGTVLIRLPGSSSFTPLSAAIDVPLGSTIDATSGRVSLTVALPDGASETGQFYGGEFVVTQSASGMLIATLAGGSFTGCPTAPTSGGNKGAALIAASKKKPTTVVRQLWGNAHGNYTTKGRYGSAAVSGTIWLTQDRCDGTFVRVTKDNVIVVAYAHPHKKHNVRQGHHILIPAPGY
jgi:hypothetical protein